MNSSQSVTTPVQLSVVGPSENIANDWNSCLRDAGIATRLQYFSKLDQLESNKTDVLLCATSFEDLEQSLNQVRKKRPDLPIILLQNGEDRLSTTQAMQFGATDLVFNNNLEHLLLVVQREMQNVRNAYNFSRVNKALQEAEKRCSLLLASAQTAISYVHEGMHIYANKAYIELFGFAELDELEGLPIMDLLDSESAVRLKEKMKFFRQTGKETEFEFSAIANSNDKGDKNADGNAVCGKMTLTAAEYEGEDCMQISVRESDATDAKAPAPSSPRGNLLEFLKDAARDQSNVEGGRLTLFIAEINGYEALQAQLGLQAASDYANELISRLTPQLGSHTRIDEHRLAFSVIEDGVVLDAKDPAENLRAKCEAQIIEANEKSIRSTVTVAGAHVDEGLHGQALDEAFRLLLESCHDGESNCVLLKGAATKNNEDVSSEAESVLKRIYEAIENQSFMLLFQPIISLRGDADEHYEVFLRMLNDKGEQIAPDEFLQTAIDHDVAGKIDRWVILQSIKLLSVHRAKGHDTRLTINVTSNSVRDPEFSQWLTVAIKAARLPSDAVIFQITEQDASTYLRQTREFVEGLKALHCRASLSRFGTLEDSLETLRHIPVDFVKLHPKLVEDSDDDDGALTETIRKLQSNGKLTIVPMVESAGVLSALWQAGANYIQGYYLQEPTVEMDYDFINDD